MQAAKQNKSRAKEEKDMAISKGSGRSYLIVAVSDDDGGRCEIVGASGGETRTVGRGSWRGGAAERGVRPCCKADEEWRGKKPVQLNAESGMLLAAVDLDSISCERSFLCGVMLEDGDEFIVTKKET
ncbi:uncharacterized protein SPSK_00935 [Sporothrix schenckii 1099-18]|uniref:Uncharacterized protein n=1 Tax=Sporothrix schenckii 1099-18 TaxID=1397361 RepID=A0A0F2LXY9_SPOSC|nr:uncharacterized protein SPSK_00935 [Sporothrix schenckii 1099-18]KJR81704.1 hypothetical protein SPSK_00935 [Sporothrix schenckii 1099-18]